MPGDKSMSHRALMFGAVAIGETTIKGLLEAEDVINTAKAMTALGAKAERGADGVWRVQGVGVAGLRSPASAARFRQFRHRRPARHGPDGDDTAHRALRRRCLAVEAPDGPRHGSARRSSARRSRRPKATACR